MSKNEIKEVTNEVKVEETTKEPKEGLIKKAGKFLGKVVNKVQAVATVKNAKKAGTAATLLATGFALGVLKDKFGGSGEIDEDGYEEVTFDDVTEDVDDDYEEEVE